MAAFFSLSCGAVLDLAISPYAGKGNSEMGMLRQLWEVLRPGDVMLADRYMCAWHEIFLLKQRGVEVVIRLNHHRKADFRRGERLGKGDHNVCWLRPYIRSLSGQAQKQLPEYLEVRETRVVVQQPGFRSRKMVVVTTLLDAEEVTVGDLADLYRARWNAELDLRSLKQTLQMDILRCKTPELVRKEIWTHILAYNLIRAIIAQAATKHNVEPRTISFKGAVQTLEAFQPLIAIQGDRDRTRRQNLVPTDARCCRHASRRRSSGSSRTALTKAQAEKIRFDARAPARDQMQNAKTSYRKLSAIRRFDMCAQPVDDLS
jgi:hypothetical protein